MKRFAWRTISVFVDELVVYRAWYNATRSKTEWDRRNPNRIGLASSDVLMRDSGLATAVEDPNWLIICPAWDTRPDEAWGPAGGHFFYELIETARDRYGPDAVNHLRVDSGSNGWQDAVVGAAKELNPSHILCQIEIDPDGSGEWTYDILLSKLRKFWSGTFVMLLYDSVYHLHLARLDRITRRDPSCLVAAIDRDVTGLYRGNAHCIGPLLLPISRRSIDLLDASTSTSGQSIDGDISFVGATYDYRAKLLDELTQVGIRVSANPQIDNEGTSSYPSYIGALSASGSTLNFARAHIFNIPQLKCRVLEASAFGCVVFSDDEKLTGTYFTPGQEFVFFHSPEDLRMKLDYYKNHGEALEEIRVNARAKARVLASVSFWDEIDAGLAQN